MAADEARPVLFCRICHQPAQYDDAGELLKCCGVIHMTSDPPEPIGRLKITRDDARFLRAIKVDPEV